MVAAEPPRSVMKSTPPTTMTASPTSAATRRAPNRERLEGGTGVKLPVGANRFWDPERR